MTPEVWSQIIIGVFALFASGLVVLGLWFTPWFRSRSIARQNSVIWIAASSTSAAVCILPLVVLLVHRLARR